MFDGSRGNEISIVNAARIFGSISGSEKTSSLLRSYFHRFKIIDDPTCLCKKSSQTADHLLWEYELLRKQRQVLRNSIMNVGGNWPITNSDLANKYTKRFQKFVNTINFETW
jgi:hypothetical protein